MALPSWSKGEELQQKKHVPETSKLLSQQPWMRVIDWVPESARGEGPRGEGPRDPPTIQQGDERKPPKSLVICHHVVRRGREEGRGV